MRTTAQRRAAAQRAAFKRIPRRTKAQTRKARRLSPTKYLSRKRRIRHNPSSAWADAFNPLNFKPTWQKAVVGVGLIMLLRKLTAPTINTPAQTVAPRVNNVQGWR